MKKSKKTLSCKPVYKYLEIIQKSGYFRSYIGDDYNIFMEITVISVHNIQQWLAIWETHILFLLIVLLSNGECSSSCPSHC